MISPVPAPPPPAVPGFAFGGGISLETSSNPKLLYKSFVEFTLRSVWRRPTHLDDRNFVAEVEVAINGAGQIIGNEWRKGSGNLVWDNSVRQALAQTHSLARLPPAGFPAKVLLRFDVQALTDALQP